jgi:hypothetical protein
MYAKCCLSQPLNAQETIMSTRPNGFTYAKEFVGNLRGESEPVPVRVNTRLRVAMKWTTREVQEHKGRTQCVPQYIPGHGADLPLHPSLQAMGRHYFSW